MKHPLQSAAKCLGVGAALSAAAYLSYVGLAWCRYGHCDHPKSSGDSLDRFLPDFEVREHHRILVDAPAETTFAAACSLDLLGSPIVRSIILARKMILRAAPDPPHRPIGLIDQAKIWGWGLLSETPGREMVYGGITQPWLANPVFQALPPEHFLTFQEPGYIKIVWNLRVDPIDATTSLASTETRVAATDPVARARFRRYWAMFSPGSILIRRLALRRVKSSSEQPATD